MQLFVIILLCSAIRDSISATHCNNKCHWNGHCNNDGTCRCYDGFTGSDCAVDCGCSGHGTCQSDNTCKCDNGWKWSVTQHKCVWDCQCPHNIQCIGPDVCGCSINCHQGTCWNGQCECFEGYTGSDCSHYNPNIMANKGVAMGINLGGLTYYSSELKFVDIAKQSQSWITTRTSGPHAHEWDTHEQNVINWRADGYPASLPANMNLGKLMLRSEIGNHAPRGNYTLLYDGEGEIDFRLAKIHTIYNGKGRKLVSISTTQDGVELLLRNTNPLNPVHNIRLIMPGFEDRYERFPFYPPFLETIKRYSELRFMDFMHTNGHEPEPTTWENRRHTTHHTHTGSQGAAIEHMIDLSNRIGASPWFNMPHAADDNYVVEFAKLVEHNLRSDLKIYVEYSNEVWNGIFRQAQYTREEGMKLHLDTHSYRAGMKYYNKRSAEIMDLWETVFHSQAERLVPVWAWQTGYQDYTRQALQDLGNRTYKFKALAITGYFSCDNLAGKHAAQMLNMSMDQMATYCNNELPHVKASFQHYMDVAKNHNLKLVMYEGGPAILENSAIAHGISHSAVTNKAIAFNKDPHIEPVVDNVLEAWNTIVSNDPQNTSPGGLFNYFSSTGTPSKYGSWGMLEYTGQNPGLVPKYRATHEFITKHNSHNPVDIQCSFLENSPLGYGCFLQKHGAMHWRCGVTDDDAVTWSYYPDVGTIGDTLVLDGFNPHTYVMYVRSVDKICVNSYHSIDTRSTSNKWITYTNADYYSIIASRQVKRRLPNQVYHNLDTQARCP